MIRANFLFCLVALAFVCHANAAPDGDDGRIVNGQQILISQAPYMVQIRNNGYLHCGGSLIAPSFVLTAAHCVHGFNVGNFMIVAGATTVNEVGIQRRVTLYTVHPEYNPQTMHTDIAVLKLNAPILNTPIIKLCDVPPREGEMVQVSGWGRVGENLPASTNLRTVSLPVRSQQACVNEYTHFVRQNMFCASGYAPIGSCRGDSGGPAVYRGQVCGLVAFSYKCGEVGHLDAYTNVYNLRDFVRQFMNSN